MYYYSLGLLSAFVDTCTYYTSSTVDTSRSFYMYVFISSVVGRRIDIDDDDDATAKLKNVQLLFCLLFFLLPKEGYIIYFSFLPSLLESGAMAPDAMSASRSDLSSLKATTT